MTYTNETVYTNISRSRVNKSVKYSHLETISPESLVPLWEQCNNISANALSVVLPKPMAVFLALHKLYTDSQSLITFADPGRLGLPLDRFFGGIDFSNNLFHCLTCKNQKLFTDMDTTIVCCSNTILDGILKALIREIEQDITANPQLRGKWRIFHI